MASKQSIPSEAGFATAVAPLAAALAAWREHRSNSREPIPATLWQKMVPLAQRYGVSRVTQALRVNYGGLKGRLVGHVPGKARPRGFTATSGFVEVPVNGWPGTAQWSLELEDRAGCKLTLRTGLGDSAAALALAQGLWSHRA